MQTLRQTQAGHMDSSANVHADAQRSFHYANQEKTMLHTRNAYVVQLCVVTICSSPNFHLKADTSRTFYGVARPGRSESSARLTLIDAISCGVRPYFCCCDRINISLRGRMTCRSLPPSTSAAERNRWKRQVSGRAQTLGNRSETWTRQGQGIEALAAVRWFVASTQGYRCTQYWCPKRQNLCGAHKPCT